MTFGIIFLFLVTCCSFTYGLTPCSGDWELVYHAVSGNGQSFMDTWQKKFTKKCEPFTDNCQCYYREGCLSPKLRMETLGVTPRKILRSPKIDYWNCLNIKRVRMELNKESKTVAFIEFNGQGSNYMNWFHRGRVLKSSWIDLRRNGRFNFFSMKNEWIGLASYRRGVDLEGSHLGSFIKFENGRWSLQQILKSLQQKVLESLDQTSHKICPDHLGLPICDF